jgi:hypothetical protein
MSVINVPIAQFRPKCRQVYTSYCISPSVADCRGPNVAHETRCSWSGMSSKRPYPRGLLDCTKGWRPCEISSYVGLVCPPDTANKSKRHTHTSRIPHKLILRKQSKAVSHEGVHRATARKKEFQKLSYNNGNTLMRSHDLIICNKIFGTPIWNTMFCFNTLSLKKKFSEEIRIQFYSISLINKVINLWRMKICWPREKLYLLKQTYLDVSSES